MKNSYVALRNGKPIAVGDDKKISEIADTQGVKKMKMIIDENKSNTGKRL